MNKEKNNETHLFIVFISSNQYSEKLIRELLDNNLGVEFRLVTDDIKKIKYALFDVWEKIEGAYEFDLKYKNFEAYLSDAVLRKKEKYKSISVIWARDLENKISEKCDKTQLENELKCIKFFSKMNLKQYIYLNIIIDGKRKDSINSKYLIDKTLYYLDMNRSVMTFLIKEESDLSHVVSDLSEYIKSNLHSEDKVVRKTTNIFVKTQYKDVSMMRKLFFTDSYLLDRNRLILATAGFGFFLKLFAWYLKKTLKIIK